MENLNIQTTQNVAIQHRVASVGERLLAAMLDYLILFSYYLVVSIILTHAEAENGYLITFLVLFPYLFYHLLSEIFMNGQSLGKKALKIKVIKIDGSQPSIGAYFTRWLFRFVDIGISTGSVAIVTIVANGKGQRVGDIVAKTAVVSIKDTNNLDDTIFTEAPRNYQVQYEEVKFLNDRDIQTIKEVLSHYYKNVNKVAAVNMIKQTREAIVNKLGIEAKGTPGEFLKTILRDYTAVYKQ